VLAPLDVGASFHPFRRGASTNPRAFSVCGCCRGSATLGLVLGGFFADLVSWRAGFFINLPIGVCLIVAARRHIDETQKQPGKFDVGGAISSTMGMTALVYSLVRAADAGWGMPSCRRL